MKPALGAEGRAALAHVMGSTPLLAFDFDGTLAPIVARPQDARVPLPVARRLARLAAQWPVAVVTGRAVGDVADRLGFEPRFLVGSHGAEDPADPEHLRWSRALEPTRRRLQAHQAELAAAGVQVEDKRHSIALHYRLAPQPALAQAAIDAVLQGVHAAGTEVACANGKCVVNLTAVGAPDKGDAVLGLAHTTHAGAALFIGDDLNDEPVFDRAPPGWMTVRIGHTGAESSARYYLDGTSQITALLQSAIDLMAVDH